MTNLEKQFHIAQSRLKRQRIPLFSVELASVDAPDNSERILKYQAKRNKALTCYAGEARRVAA